MGGTGLEPVTPSLSIRGGRSRQFARVRSDGMVERNPSGERTPERTRANVERCHCCHAAQSLRLVLTPPSALPSRLPCVAGDRRTIEAGRADGMFNTVHTRRRRSRRGNVELWAFRDDGSIPPTVIRYIGSGLGTQVPSPPQLGDPLGLPPAARGPPAKNPVCPKMRCTRTRSVPWPEVEDRPAREPATLRGDRLHPRDPNEPTPATGRRSRPSPPIRCPRAWPGPGS